MDELFAAVADVGWLVYLLTFLLVFLETSGLPLPALTFALLAATLAGSGSLNFGVVVLVTILGGTLGGPVGRWLGQRQGRPLVERIGSRVKITPQRIDSTQQQFEKRGKLIVTGRFFVPVLPWSAGLFAGIARMPKGTLFLFNFIGITLWALIELTIVAYFSSQLKDWLARFSVTGLFWLLTGAIGTFFLVRAIRRRRAAAKAAAVLPAAGAEPATEPTAAQEAMDTRVEQRASQIAHMDFAQADQAASPSDGLGAETDTPADRTEHSTRA